MYIYIHIGLVTMPRKAKEVLPEKQSWDSLGRPDEVKAQLSWTRAQVGARGVWTRAASFGIRNCTSNMSIET